MSTLVALAEQIKIKATRTTGAVLLNWKSAQIVQKVWADTRTVLALPNRPNS